MNLCNTMSTEDTTKKSYISEKIWGSFEETYFPSYNFTTEGVVLRDDIHQEFDRKYKTYQTVKRYAKIKDHLDSNLHYGISILINRDKTDIILDKEVILKIKAQSKHSWDKERKLILYNVRLKQDQKNLAQKILIIKDPHAIINSKILIFLFDLDEFKESKLIQKILSGKKPKTSIAQFFN